MATLQEQFDELKGALVAALPQLAPLFGQPRHVPDFERVEMTDAERDAKANELQRQIDDLRKTRPSTPPGTPLPPAPPPTPEPSTRNVPGAGPNTPPPAAAAPRASGPPPTPPETFGPFDLGEPPPPPLPPEA